MARRSRENVSLSNSPDPNAWMVTFGDLIMLLLTFFVMLLTMKSMDSRELKKMFRELQTASGPLEYIEGHIEGEVSSGEGAIRKTVWIESSDMLKDAFELLEGVPSLAADPAAIAAIRNMMEITEDARGVVITLAADNLFEVARADIKPGRLVVLDAVAAVLQNAVNDIVVIGHTDNVPIYGSTYKSNWELSLYRALSVYYYLADATSMDADRMAVGGAGDEQPRYANDTPENRAKNRRVEFVIKKRRLQAQ